MSPPRPHAATPGAWLVGALVGLAIAWRMPGDLLLNVDLVVGPEIPWPGGMVGDGPELPRRTPFWIPLAAASRVVPGPHVVALGVVAAWAALGAGASRFAPPGRGRPEIVALLATTIPFVTTRLVVGHLPLVVAVVLAVWHGHRLVWPGRGRWWTLLAFGLTGSSGAVIGLSLFVIGWLAPGSGPLRARAVDLGRLLLTQLPWLLPGVVVASRIGLGGGDGSAFVTEIDGALGLPRLLAGGGFFIRAQDLARETPAAAALGLVLLAIVVVDVVRSGFDRRHATGVVGLVTASSTGLPLVGSVLSDAAGWGPLGVVREPQKFVALWLLAALWSGARLGDRPVEAAAGPSSDRCSNRARPMPAWALAVGVLVPFLAAPAVFGADGRLVASELPGWDDAAVAIDAGDVVLALPWERYGRYDLGDGRHALGPVPWLVDGVEVRASGDAGLGRDAVERVSPEPEAHALLGRDHRLGRPVAEAARALGIDLVVVVADGRNRPDELLADPGLEPVVVEVTYAVFRVRSADS